MAFCWCLLLISLQTSKALENHTVLHLKRKQISQRLVSFHPKKISSVYVRLLLFKCYLSSSIPHWVELQTSESSVCLSVCLTLTMLEPKCSAPASPRFLISLLAAGRQQRVLVLSLPTGRSVKHAEDILAPLWANIWFVGRSFRSFSAQRSYVGSTNEVGGNSLYQPMTMLVSSKSSNRIWAAPMNDLWSMRP